MFYVLLALDSGIVEVPPAASAALEEEVLVLRGAGGEVVCRFPKLSVLAYSQDRDQLEGDADLAEEGGGV